MNETLERAIGRSLFHLDSSWHGRLDDLVCGECSEDEFLEAVWRHREVDPDSVWDVVALLDQKYRRGQIPVGLFRSVESKIAQRELSTHYRGETGNRRAAAASFNVGFQAMALTLEDHGAQACAPESDTYTTTVEFQARQPLNSPIHLEQRQPPSSFESGLVLRDRYVLGARLGRGGMGTVFNAVDRYRCDLREADRHVAIKVLHEKMANRPDVMANLRREFYCAQRLSHRNIVKVYELDHSDGVAFFTMELLSGEPLSCVIERMRPRSIPRSYIWAIIRDVGAGLAHAHSRQVVHADIKPQNIMITALGEVRILDFGTSSVATRERWSADGNRKEHYAAASPAYACCELLDGQKADPRDDLYALACLSYELLAGVRPFPRRTSIEARALGMVPPRPPGLTRRQWQALAMGLSWSREDRSISVRDWLVKMGVGPEPEGRLPCPDDQSTAGQHRRMLPSLMTVTLLALLLICTATLISLNRPSFGRISTVNDSVPTIPAGSDPPRSTSREPVSSTEPITLVSLATVDLGPVLRPPALLPAPRPAPRPVSKNAGVAKISLFAGRYRVRAGQNFAEIRVRRPSGSDADRFVWWTEPSSAKPGVDYVPQDRTIRVLPKGERNATLFVKLIPHASRSRSEIFYIAMNGLNNTSPKGGVTRAAILLPASN